MSLKEGKRKYTLKKKASELATLCDVRVCMVCFGPDESKVETWPENKTEVLDVINMYYQRVNSDQKGKQINNRAKQQDDLFGFLGSKKENNLDQEKLLSNKGKEPADTTNQGNIVNGNNKYWDETLKQFSAEELMGLCTSLDSKLKILRGSIRVLQNSNKKEMKAKAVQVSNNNWESNTITNPNNDHHYMHITVIDHNGGDHNMMMNECCYHQPLLPLLLFTDQLSYNQQPFESPFNNAAVRPSNGGGGGGGGRSGDFRRQEGDIDNNFSLGVGHANTTN